jgi:hypothetical protein
MSRVYGVDFTSAPSRRKPLTCAIGQYQQQTLTLTDIITFTTFTEFETWLTTSGRWTAALDFPFGLPRLFTESAGWGNTWDAHIDALTSYQPHELGQLFSAYRDAHPAGQKEPPRRIDRLVGSVSAMKWFNPPVGRMYRQGAPRVARAGVSVYPCAMRSDPRRILEAYPALVARTFIQRSPYKSDAKKNQTPERTDARQSLIHALTDSLLTSPYEMQLKWSTALQVQCLTDSTGDRLDAVLCAIQAAWSLNHLPNTLPQDADTEGWIVDPVSDRALR